MVRGGSGYANTNNRGSTNASMNGNGNGNGNGRMYQNQTQNRWSAQSQSANNGSSSSNSYGNGGPPNRYGSSYGARTPNSRNSNPRDRETGQYTPTRYGASSLEDEMKRNDEAKTKEPEEEEAEAEKMSEADLESIRSQFLTLMEKNIKVNTERREKEKAESVLEEDTKKDDESAATESVSGSGSEKCVVIGGKGKKGKGNYGSYGTTFDRHNVCWEFNTFVGCRKGSACKWAHQYLAKESAHPYTGEKLNGMAVRRFRKSNNI